MRLISQVTSSDTSSMLLKRFPRGGFFNFGNKSKSGGLRPPEFDLDGESEFCRFLSTRTFDNVIRLPELTVHNIIS
jgi:hypothetical protein